MTGYERTSEDAENERVKSGRWRRGEVSRWEDGDGYLTGIYGEPIFSFDYSTRANAPRLSRRLHLTVDRDLKFWKRKKARRKSEKPVATTAWKIQHHSRKRWSLLLRAKSTAGYVDSSRPSDTQTVRDLLSRFMKWIVEGRAWENQSRVRRAWAINQDSYDNEIQCFGSGCVSRVLSKAPIYLSYKTVWEQFAHKRHRAERFSSSNRSGHRHSYREAKLGLWDWWFFFHSCGIHQK